MAADYQVLDNSILVPPLKRFVWGPLIPLIPERVSANSLTLLGTALSAAAFFITVFVPASRLTCAVVALLVFAYLTLDNIDGAHARRTGTSSPLGEFLDHWLDSINNTLLFMGAIYTWRIPADKSVIIMMLAVFSYTFTFWEQRVIGRIHMAMLGNVEGIMAVILFYVAGVVFGPKVLIETKVIFGQTIIDLFWISAVINTSVTSLGPIIRVRRNWIGVVEVLAPVLAIGAWYALGRIGAHPACQVLMLLSPALAGRMLIARVTRQETIGPDRLLIVAASGAAIVSLVFPLGASVEAVLLDLVFAYALILVSLDFVLTVRRLGDYLRPGELLGVARLRLRG
jgi:phosphatidylglycerophosphate synthase